jgi:hypothetical protein
MVAEFNIHSRDFYGNTIEFNVKSPNLRGVSEELYEHEYTTGAFTNSYSDKLFTELNYDWLNDWSFAGRSNGWFVLLTDRDINTIPQRTLGRIERIVNKYCSNYNRELLYYYGVSEEKVAELN